MYDKQVMNLAIKDLHAFLQQRDISLAEASLRWLYHHSALETEDGLILGATKAAEKGPLPGEVVKMFEKTWDAVKEAAP